jgi:cobalt-zinc-cadmium efflux system outer membrane protein
VFKSIIRPFLMTPRLFLACAILASLSALAAQAEPITLNAAVRQALGRNPELAAAALGPEAARGRVDQAIMKANPSLEAGVQSDLITGNTGARKFDLGLSQAIPLGNRLREAQSVARVDVTLAAANLANRQRLIVGEITQSFVEIYALDQQAALRDRMMGVDHRLAELARARAKIGEVSSLEVNAAMLELARLEQEQFGLLAERASRVQRLKPLLGMAPAETLEVADDLDALLSAVGTGIDGDKSTWNRPDLRVATLAIARVEAEQRVARAEVRGDLTVGATYGYERGPLGDADHLLGVKFSVPLPLQNKNQGRLRELRAERTRAQREAEGLELAIASEVATARQRAVQNQKILDNYRSAVLPLGETAERDLAAAYQQGQVPLFQVIQSQQQRLALETGALEARAAYARALVALQTATGRNPQLPTTLAVENQP